MRFEMTPNKRALPAAMLALTLMGLHAGSQAGTITTQHGSQCKAYGWRNPDYGNNGVDGFHSHGTPPDYESLGVVCPVTRVGLGTRGALRVWIDGDAPTGSEVSCTLWSFSDSGLPLASQSFAFISTGAHFDKYLELTSASVPTYSSQVVTCELPNEGDIYDIEPISL
jgi:hypothetical protein